MTIDHSSLDDELPLGKRLSRVQTEQLGLRPMTMKAKSSFFDGFSVEKPVQEPEEPKEDG